VNALRVVSRRCAWELMPLVWCRGRVPAVAELCAVHTCKAADYDARHAAQERERIRLGLPKPLTVGDVWEAEHGVPLPRDPRGNP